MVDEGRFIRSLYWDRPLLTFSKEILVSEQRCIRIPGNSAAMCTNKPDRVSSLLVLQQFICLRNFAVTDHFDGGAKGHRVMFVPLF